MRKHTTLTALFATLHGSLPYEYDELLVNNESPDQAIIISKPDAEYTICITANTPDDNGILDVTTYASDQDDDPIETTQWDTDDPDFSLIDIIAYVEKRI